MSNAKINFTALKSMMIIKLINRNLSYYHIDLYLIIIARRKFCLANYCTESSDRANPITTKTSFPR